MNVPDHRVDLFSHVEGDGEDAAGVLAEGNASRGEQRGGVSGIGPHPHPIAIKDEEGRYPAQVGVGSLRMNTVGLL